MLTESQRRMQAILDSVRRARTVTSPTLAQAPRQGIYKVNLTMPQAKRDALLARLRADLHEPTEEITDTVIILRGRTKTRRRLPPKLAFTPPLLTVEQCTKRLQEARVLAKNALELLPRKLSEQSTTYHHAWHRIDKVQRKRVGRAAAKILARHDKYIGPFREDYVLMDKAVGHKVERANKVKAHYDTWLHYCVQIYAGGNLVPHTRHEQQGTAVWELEESAVMRTLRARVDVTYWEEMLRLAQEREAK